VILAVLILAAPRHIISADFLYVTDTGNNRIQKLSIGGIFLQAFESGLLSPGSIASSLDAGYIYTADTGNNRIVKFDSSGNVVRVWGGRGSEQGMFSLPAEVLVVVDGGEELVLVADTGNNRIQKFTSGGIFIEEWSGFNSPQGLARCRVSGDVYVVDTGNHRVKRYTVSGALLYSIGGSGSAEGKFRFPRGADVDSLGRLYVADCMNYRVQRFSSSGAYEMMFGSRGGGDGAFDDHFGVAVDAYDNVYVSDSGNNRVQKFDSYGRFTAVFGCGDAITGNGCFYYPQGIDCSFAGKYPVSEPMPIPEPTPEPTPDVQEGEFITIVEDTPVYRGASVNSQTWGTAEACSAYKLLEIGLHGGTFHRIEYGSPSKQGFVESAKAVIGVSDYCEAVKTGGCAVRLAYTVAGKEVKTGFISAPYKPFAADRRQIKAGKQKQIISITGMEPGGYRYEINLISMSVAIYDYSGCYYSDMLAVNAYYSAANRAALVLWLAYLEVYASLQDKKTLRACSAAVEKAEPETVNDAFSAETVYAYPNPARGPVTIRFSLAGPADVRIIITDIGGRPVWSRQITGADTRAGVNRVVWGLENSLGAGAARGIYIMRVESGGEVVTKKIAVAEGR